MGELGGAGDDDESFGEPADERVEGGLVVEEPSEVHATASATVRPRTARRRRTARTA
jgi:hypothetical protein